MLIIRLQRKGKKNQPYFRIVAADSRRHVKAKAIQILGNFNPRSKELNFNKEKIVEFLDKGASISNRLSRLLKNKIKHARIKVVDRPAKKPKTKGHKQKTETPKTKPETPDMTKLPDKKEPLDLQNKQQ